MSADDRAVKHDSLTNKSKVQTSASDMAEIHGPYGAARPRAAVSAYHRA